ncbi:MAG TPA: alpha/beta fold hydrolase [Dehalococcoidia bacterium]|nr:alpha/beta fold hydrolase [Dehalococcoidia bacterium]
MDAPPVQYAKTSDGYDIAYGVSGDGPTLVFTGAGLMNLELAWRMPHVREWLQALTARFRVVQLDPRGSGRSTRDLTEEHAVEHYQRDIAAVVDRLGLERFVLFGHAFLPTCIATQYAVQNPGRVSAVILSAAVGALSAHRAPALYTSFPAQDWDIFLRTIIEVANRPQSPAEADEMLELFKQTYDKRNFLLMVAAANRFSLLDLLPQLKTPALVLSTPGISFYPQDETQKVAQLAHGQLVSLDGQAALGDPEQGMRAIEAFLADLPSTPAQPAASAAGGSPDGLSSREVEVLRLLAQGKSNPEIAKELFITRNTVQNHVSNILIKTNLQNRAQAAVYAKEHGLA